MDTSMDDLFSDLEKSAHPVGEHAVDEKKPKADSFTYREAAFDQQLNVVIWHSDQYQNALVYEIRLSDESAGVSGSIELLVPETPAYGASSNPSRWPPVQPCVLSSHQLNRSLHTPASVPVFGLPDSLLRAVWPSNSDVRPQLIWLLGLSDGWIYAFACPKQSAAAVHYTTLCSVPGLVTKWAVLTDPIFTGARPAVSGACRPVSTVLMAFNSVGSGGVALWTVNGDEQETGFDNALRATEFHLPPAPSPLCHVQVHGSWVHLATESGHLLSLHFTSVRPADTDAIDLVCQPANFPRVPSLLFPSVVRGSEADRALQPRWRYFDVAEFARLSDGHLGIVQRSGRITTRLADLLCRPELTDPRGQSELPDVTDPRRLSELMLVHSYYQAYLGLLRLCGCKIQPGSVPTSVRGNQRSLEHLITIQTGWLSDRIEGQTRWRLSFDVNLPIPANPPSAFPSSPGLWESLSEGHLAWLLLRAHSNNPLCTFSIGGDGRDDSAVCNSPMDLVVRIRPVYFRPNETGSGKRTEYDGPVQWSYSEPLWALGPDGATESNTDSIAGSAKCATIRRSVLSHAHLTEFYARLLDDPANHNGVIGCRVQLYLAIRPPFVPSSVLPRIPSQPFPYRIVGPSLQVTLGSFLLDALHWLSPIDMAPQSVCSWLVNKANAVTSTPLSMCFRLVSDTQLSSILSCIFKDANTRYNGLDNAPPSTTTSFNPGECGRVQLTFLPTGQRVRFEWSWTSRSQASCDTKENASDTVQPNRYTGFRISSSCLRTLWSLAKAVERLVRSSLSSTSMDCSVRPSVEDLRREYVLLKNLASTLTGWQAEAGSEAAKRKPEDLLGPLLEAYCTVRNSDAARLFS